jgi:hypothetical protein
MMIYKPTVYYLAALFILSVFFLTSLPAATAAGIGDWQTRLDQGAGDQGAALYNTEQEATTAQTIAKYLGALLMITPFLGFILVALLILAGYQWMTAAGNSEKVEIAKKRIRNALIGIIILTAIYLIAYFIISRLSYVTGYNI